MKRQGNCTAIALYDLDKENINFKGLFELFEDCFVRHGLIPLRGSANADDIKTKKTSTFKYTKKTLETRNFENITGFWFGAYGLIHTDDEFDALFSLYLDVEKKSHFNFYFHHDVLQYDQSEIEGLIIDISQYLKAGYGIVYNRDFNKGPGLYAMGIITGLDDRIPEEDIEEERIACWWRAYNFEDSDYKLGLLRDIYPMNLLSEPHLSQPVFETHLQNWIESSPDHGELKKLTDTLWEWWVPEDKIEFVRETLKPTGLLLCA